MNAWYNDIMNAWYNDIMNAWYNDIMKLKSESITTSDHVNGSIYTHVKMSHLHS